MITTKPRTLVVGGTGLVWAYVEDVNGANLSAVGVELRTVAPDGTVGSWSAPTVEDVTKAGQGIVRAALVHTASVVGLWELQAKVGTEIIKAGPFQVIEP